MWVRSQNKKNLGKYSSFAVHGSSVIGYQGPLDGEGAILGIYKNESDAIFVINNIENYIAGDVPGQIFCMPLDSEVRYE